MTERTRSLTNLSWRLVIVLTVIITATIYLLPSIVPTLWPYKKINLGLDLQGGMHLVLEVDTDKAVESTTERISHEIRSLFKKERIRHKGVSIVEGTRISATSVAGACSLGSSSCAKGIARRPSPRSLVSTRNSSWPRWMLV